MWTDRVCAARVRRLGAVCSLFIGPVFQAAAFDDDRALAPFVRLAAAAMRGSAVDPIEWERRLRDGSSLGPRRPGIYDRLGLVAAARAGQNERVRELLRRGAEIDGLNADGFTPLGAAAFAGHRSTVRLLLGAGADPARFGASGQTAMHLASLAGQIEVIDELLRLKVDIELLNRQRETALDVAAGVSQQSAMSRLLEAGANADAAGQR